MLISKYTFWAAKKGNSENDYEDAFSPEEELLEHYTESYRCAIADGATEASFSAQWAKLLCDRWSYSNQTFSDFLATLPDISELWLQNRSKEPLPWYAEEKAQSGAFSSLLALELSTDPSGLVIWHAYAVGDSCVFQVSQEEVSQWFPIQQAVDFGNRPFLIGTPSSAQAQLGENVNESSGECKPGDTLYLMTDALACWFLGFHEQDERPATLIGDIQQSRFIEFISEYRTLIDDTTGSPMLRNDDVTLMRIDIH